MNFFPANSPKYNLDYCKVKWILYQLDLVICLAVFFDWSLVNAWQNILVILWIYISAILRLFNYVFPYFSELITKRLKISHSKGLENKTKVGTNSE